MAVTFRRIVREAMIAIVVGVVAFLAAHWVKNYSFVGDEEIGLQDQILRTRADTQASSVVPPFVLIDLSARDEYALGYPPVAPRDLLAKILALVAAGDPRLIVLDVDLGWADTQNSEEALKQILTKLGQRNRPKVLLVRQPFSRGDGSDPDFLRLTPYDSTVSGSHNLIWISALAPLDGDGIVRRYRLALQICRAGRRFFLPGVQAAACAAFDQTDAWTQLRAISNSRGDCADPHPANEQSYTAPSPLRCRGQDWPLQNAGGDVENRL